MGYRPHYFSSLSRDYFKTVEKLQIVSLRGGVIDDEAIFSPEIQGLLRRRTPRNDTKMSFRTVSTLKYAFDLSADRQASSSNIKEPTDAAERRGIKPTIE